MRKPCHQNCRDRLNYVHSILLKILKSQESLYDHLIQKSEEEAVYLNAKQVRDRVGVSERTLARLHEKGQLPYSKMVDGKRLYRFEEVEHFRKARLRLT